MVGISWGDINDSWRGYHVGDFTGGARGGGIRRAIMMVLQFHNGSKLQ